METPHELQDGLNIVFTDSFFDVVCLLADLDDTEIGQWKKGTMQYGLFKQQYIPFFVLDNGAGLILSVHFNILQLKSKRLAQWLQHTENQVRLKLIEKKTSKVEATRIIILDRTVVAGIRQYLQQQYIRYSSKQAVAEKSASIAARLNPEEMLETAATFGARWTCCK